MQPDPATYSVKEFAAVMGISKASAYQLCSGEPPQVPTVRLGRTIRISRAWVQGLLEGRYTLAERAHAEIAS